MPLRIAIYSDLHLEFEKHRSELRLADTADVRVLAGDIGTRGRWVNWVLEQGEIPTIIVLGNHEYYHEAYPSHLLELKERFSGTHVHLLENESVDLFGFKFLGATLWSDYALYGAMERDLCMNMAQYQLSDFKAISTEQGRPFTPSDAARLCHESVSWLESELSNCIGSKTIVVTHHAPSERSVEPKFAGSRMNGAFASNLEPLIERHNPALWIHGHVHHSLDYQIGATNILCNPRGYAGVELNPGFQNPHVVAVA